MHTLQINIEDGLYKHLTQKGIDIENNVQAFLSDLLDEGYPAISTEEAKKRVAEAVKRYETNSGEYIDAADYDARKQQTIQKLK